jgi:hypothetical protein
MNEKSFFMWLAANKTHIFALVGAGLAATGFALHLLTWEQALAVAGACGGMSLLKHDTDVKVDQQTDDIDKDNKAALKVQTKELKPMKSTGKK